MDPVPPSSPQSDRMSQAEIPSSPPILSSLEAHDDTGDEIADEMHSPMLEQRHQCDISFFTSSYAPLPAVLHATSASPSYFLSSYLDPVSRRAKSSSPVPVFSCDAEDAADGSNYDSLHLPKKRAGTWYDDVPTKKTRMIRNLDSGVYMLSDGSSSFDSLPRHTAPFAVPVSTPRPSISAQQKAFEAELDATLDMNADRQDFSHLDLVDANIGRIGELNSMIKNLPDRGDKRPWEGEYRSLVPRLQIDLSNNRLCRLRPALFTLQHLTSLNLVYNNIAELPPDIGCLSKLNILNIGHNPIHWLPYEILPLLKDRLMVVGDHIPWIRRPLGLDRALGLMDRHHYTTRRVARTTVDFFDEAGRSTPAPSFRKGVKSLVTLSTHSALRWRHNDQLAAADLADTLQVQAHLPCIAHDILAQASKNDLCGGGGNLRVCFLCEEQYEVATKHDTGGYGDFRACHECGKEYVVARAEWFEWWSEKVPFTHSSDIMAYPLKKKVCSWACVPDEAMAAALTGSPTW